MSEYLESDAELSACGAYRYSLTRKWREGPGYLLWIMLNPSTADHLKDDATIRKCVGFAKRWGYGAIVVANLYALRATNPIALEGAADPVGPDNNETLRELIAGATGICAGWGASGPRSLRARAVEVIAMVPGEIFCIGKTKDGYPKHPSRPGYATPIDIYVERPRATTPPVSQP